jgi:hypothetical protein
MKKNLIALAIAAVVASVPMFAGQAGQNPPPDTTPKKTSKKKAKKPSKKSPKKDANTAVQK